VVARDSGGGVGGDYRTRGPGQDLSGTGPRRRSYIFPWCRPHNTAVNLWCSVFGAAKVPRISWLWVRSPSWRLYTFSTSFAG